MLRQLRFKLTLISTLITGAILTFVCLLALGLFEQQVRAHNHLAFDNHLNTIAYQLQHNQVIKHSWLAQLETKHDLIISIEDNGNPFLFKGAWEPLTARQLLLDRAKEDFATTHSEGILPPSFLNFEKTFFEVEGMHKDLYRVGVGIIPSSNGAYTLTVLQDLSLEQSKLLHIRFLFVSISLIGLGLLGIFSFWFSNRAVKPIEIASQKQKDFIASASHELKGPLAVIYAHASSLSSKSTDTPSYIPIQKECRRLSKLIDDLLLLTTVDNSSWSIHLEPIEIDSLLIDLLDIYLPLAKEKQQKLHLQLPDALIPEITVDAERIRQVIGILLDNALHYVQAEGKITINVQLDNTALSIAIVDNGPGIPPQHQPFIFDRFYQVEKSRKDKNHYGLGLSIAQEIIQLHNGTLTFKETPSGGATFIIRLPIKKR